MRNLNKYSFQKLYPVCSVVAEVLMVQFEVCWQMGSASTGRAPQQLTESPFKYLNIGDLLNDSYQIFGNVGPEFSRLSKSLGGDTNYFMYAATGKKTDHIRHYLIHQ